MEKIHDIIINTIQSMSKTLKDTGCLDSIHSKIELLKYREQLISYKYDILILLSYVKIIKQDPCTSVKVRDMWYSIENTLNTMQSLVKNQINLVDDTIINYKNE